MPTPVAITGHESAVVCWQAEAFRTGQVIGATDRTGSDIAERPVHFSEVIATLYRHLGINPDVVKLNDLTGRPQYLLENTTPMPELA